MRSRASSAFDETSLLPVDEKSLLHSQSPFWRFIHRPSLNGYPSLGPSDALSFHRHYSGEVHLAGSSAASDDTHDAVLDAGVDAGTIFPAKREVVGSEFVFLPSGNLFIGAGCFPWVRHNHWQFQSDQLQFGITNQVAEARIRRDKVPLFRIEKVGRNRHCIEELTKCCLPTRRHRSRVRDSMVPIEKLRKYNSQRCSFIAQGISPDEELGAKSR